jgi:transcriptional regulator with XRE-family HTH domain
MPSLADVEARSGLKPSAISRLENDPQANPTLLTLQRYAAALNMTLATTVEPV